MSKLLLAESGLSAQQIYEIIGYIASFLVAISLMMKSILRLRLINLAGAIAFTIYGLLIGALPVAIVNAFIVFINIFYLRRMLAARGRDYFETLEMALDEPYLLRFLEHHQADIAHFMPEFDRDLMRGGASLERGQNLDSRVLANSRTATESETETETNNETNTETETEIRIKSDTESKSSTKIETKTETKADKRVRAVFVLRDMVPAGLVIYSDLPPDAGPGIELLLDYAIPGYRDRKTGRFVYGKDGLFEALQPPPARVMMRASVPAHAKYLQRMGFEAELQSDRWWKILADDS